MMTLDQLRKVAVEISRWSYEFQPIDWDEYEEPRYYEYIGTIVPKERPRKGRNGHFYTPAATKKAEASIKAWATGIAKVKPVTCPISMSLIINEKTDDQRLWLHSAGGVVYNNKGDVDNFGKLVCDALNRTMYKDDKQVVDLHVCRRWSDKSGFNLTVRRAGLNKSEYDILRKLLP